MTYSTAKTNLVSAMFADGFADTITYNGTDIPGHVDFLEVGPSGVQAILEVQRTDVSDPQYRDVVLYEGNTFYVVRGDDGQLVKQADDLSLILYLSRDERPVI